MAKKPTKKKAPAKKPASKKPAKPAPKPSRKALKKLPARKTSVKAAKKVPAKPKKSIKPVTKKAAIKKAPAKKAPAKKAPVVAAKKAPAKKTPAKKAPAVVTVKAPAKKKATSAKPLPTANGALRQQFVTRPILNKNLKLTPFHAKQRQRLLHLKDTLLDSMSGVARGNLHAGSETSAFGMHQADAGSDAYDRDFALSILSQEQNSLYEIDEALKRLEDGSYGKCEISEKPIPHARLEALPFTRYTVECQAELEKRQHHQRARLPINSLFGLTEEESESEEEDITENN
jgi:RNA polymerase-binding transcription factor DksA